MNFLKYCAALKKLLTSVADLSLGQLTVIATLEGSIFNSPPPTICWVYLHNGMILSTLGLSLHGFVFGLYPKRPHTNGDICPSLYTHDPPHFSSMWDFGRIPNNPPLEQRTIEPPLERLSICLLSTNQDSIHSLPTRILRSNALEAHALYGTPLASRACSIPDQLLFTMLGPGYVHEESGAPV